MAGKNAKVSLERRVRRICTRYYLHLMISQKPDKRILAHGGYMLRDGKTMKIVFGDAEYQYSATLEEVEAWLNANT